MKLDQWMDPVGIRSVPRQLFSFSPSWAWVDHTPGKTKPNLQMHCLWDFYKIHSFFLRNCWSQLVQHVQMAESARHKTCRLSRRECRGQSVTSYISLMTSEKCQSVRAFGPSRLNWRDRLNISSCMRLHLIRHGVLKCQKHRCLRNCTMFIVVVIYQRLTTARLLEKQKSHILMY